MRYLNLKPEILTHPHIPKPMHGLSPRSIMGQEWWDVERKKSYESTDYHCVACGVSKANAKKHKWLEAHEFYNIDYEKASIKIESIEPLCHYCHNFIHSGRLYKIMGKEKTRQEVIDILEHGFKILSENNLKCFPFTKELANELGCNTYGVLQYSIKNYNPVWSDWKLIFYGNEYRSKFKSYDDWVKNYE